MKQVTAYKCDHCGKKYERKDFAEHHEKYCFNNPEIWPACLDCKYLKEDRIQYVTPYENDYGESCGSAKCFKCEVKNILVYPPKVARKKYNLKYPDTFKFQELMPNKCKLKEVEH